MIVLDTNVVSELMRAQPAPVVVGWLQRSSSGGLYTTAVTVAEIRYGIARLPEGQRRETLQQAANEIFAAFPRQVPPFDLAAARANPARVAGPGPPRPPQDRVAGRERLGHPIDGFDAQIAAICRAQAATLATRNAKDFTDTGIDVIDPWQDEIS